MSLLLHRPIFSSTTDTTLLEAFSYFSMTLLTMTIFSLALGLSISCSPALAINDDHLFEEFYPRDEEELTAIMANNCSSTFHQYLNTPYTSIFGPVHACSQVISCLLSNSSEATKANMASANVLLGLIPTILALLGSTTPELSLLSSRRPFLAFLLSIGSPVVNPVRAFMYHDPVVALQKGQQYHSAHKTPK